MTSIRVPPEAEPTAPVGAQPVRPPADRLDRVPGSDRLDRERGPDQLRDRGLAFQEPGPDDFFMRGLRRLDRAWAEAEPEPEAEEVGRPVFVDRSGRRRRLAVLVGSSLAVVIVVAIVMLLAGLSGVSPLSVPGFPDVAKQTKAPAVEPSQAPAGQRPVVPAAQPTTASPTESPSPSKSSPRHIPTQTPPHPSKSK
jgi:hypothetical protein